MRGGPATSLPPHSVQSLPLALVLALALPLAIASWFGRFGVTEKILRKLRKRVTLGRAAARLF
jgi:hypothetical protein